MNSARRCMIALVIFAWTLCLALPGCSMFGQKSSSTKPQKDGPQTVGEWMKQPRVSATP